jgi:hypothetical protein
MECGCAAAISEVALPESPVETVTIEVGVIVVVDVQRFRDLGSRELSVRVTLLG